MTERDVVDLVESMAEDAGFHDWFRPPYCHFNCPEKPSFVPSGRGGLQRGTVVEIDACPATDLAYGAYGTAIVFGGGPEPELVSDAREACRAAAGFSSRWKCTGEVYVYAQAWANNRRYGIDSDSIGHVCFPRLGRTAVAWPRAARARPSCAGTASSGSTTPHARLLRSAAADRRRRARLRVPGADLHRWHGEARRGPTRRAGRRRPSRPRCGLGCARQGPAPVLQAAAQGLHRLPPRLRILHLREVEVVEEVAIPLGEGAHRGAGVTSGRPGIPTTTRSRPLCTNTSLKSDGSVKLAPETPRWTTRAAPSRRDTGGPLGGSREKVRPLVCSPAAEGPSAKASMYPSNSPSKVRSGTGTPTRTTLASKT